MEIVREPHLDSDPRARCEATAKYAEREGEVLTESITASDLTLQLAAAQVEIASHAAKQLDPQL